MDLSRTASPEETQRLLSLRTWLEKALKREPFAELTVIAYDEPIGAEKFVVAENWPSFKLSSIESDPD